MTLSDESAVRWIRTSVYEALTQFDGLSISEELCEFLFPIIERAPGNDGDYSWHGKMQLTQEALEIVTNAGVAAFESNICLPAESLVPGDETPIQEPQALEPGAEGRSEEEKIRLAHEIKDVYEEVTELKKELGEITVTETDRTAHPLDEIQTNINLTIELSEMISVFEEKLRPILLPESPTKAAKPPTKEYQGYDVEANAPDRSPVIQKAQEENRRLRACISDLGAMIDRLDL